MPMQFTCYRSYLRSVLASRVTGNPRYSLRAMARSFGMAPSLLSEVIGRGTKNLSLERADGVADKLGLIGAEKEYFLLLLQYETAKSPVRRRETLERMRALNPERNVADLSLDRFTAISEWYHVPILAMTDLHRADLSPPAIARKLGISPLEARAAMERLERLELVEKAADGRYRRRHASSLFESASAHEGLRRFHEQMLGRAGAALRTQSPSEKLVGTETFALDPEQLPEARRRTRRFLDEMVRLFDQGKKRSEVYHLGVQLFRITDSGDNR